MQLETLKNGQANYSNISDGIRGNFDTLLQMANLVKNTVDYDTGFNADIKTYFVDKGFNPYDSDEIVLKQVFEFVKSHAKFIPDKSGKIESISDARTTLKLGFGDCDDLTTLTASVLGVLGFENVNFVFATYDTEAHVYIEVFGRDKKRYVFDLSLPDAQLNAELKNSTKKFAYPVFNQDLKQTLAGVFHSVKTNAKGIATSSLNTLPYLTQFLPLGLVSANLLQQGINLISSADLSQMSLTELGKEICNELDRLAELVINRQIADNSAKTLAMQISSQLGTYQLKQGETANFANIKNIVKEKVRYIYYLIDITPELNLNAKGMIFAGCVIVGFISYKIYKKGKF